MKSDRMTSRVANLTPQGPEEKRQREKDDREAGEQD